MKTILVTGGLGFMGSDFVRFLIQEKSNWQVVNCDKQTYAANLANVAKQAKNPRYHFVKGDIADADIIEKVFKQFKPAIVVNFAAETHVDRSIMRPGDFIKTDVFGTYTLLEQAKKFGLERFHQISTDEVYGAINQGLFSETSCFAPNSPYSASKAGADCLVRAYFQTYRVPATVSHAANNYGPYQYPEKLLPLAITNLLEGKKVPVYGDGKQVREWLYVEDHSQAIWTILTKGKPGESYNIGSGQRHANLETLKVLLEVMGKSEQEFEFVKDRPGHDRRYALSSAKLRQLGWRPKVKFLQGIKMTSTWYQANRSWWQAIKSGEYLKYYRDQYVLR